MPAAVEDANGSSRNGRASCNCDPPNCVRWSFFLAGFLTVLVGLIFVGTQFADMPACTGNGCIGPSLRWGSPGFTLNRNLNRNWGTVFSLAPSHLVENWTPTFIGLISMTAHLPGFEYGWITRTWAHCSVFLIFTAIYGHLGYSGNLGILFGLATIGVGILCMIMQFTQWRNELPIMHTNFGGVVNRWSFMVDNEVILTFARVMAFCLSITTMIIGLIHVLTSSFDWCPTMQYPDCVGPSLRWNTEPAHNFVHDGNGLSGWRSIFTFNPEVFMPLWGAVIFGYIALLQHIDGRQWTWLYGSWSRVCLFWAFMALWCNFGICGTLGVITGFASIIESLLALLISIGGGHAQRTALLVRVDFLSKN